MLSTYVILEHKICWNRHHAALNSFADGGAAKPKCRDQDNEAKAEKENKSKSKPLTGFEVVEILAKKRHLGEMHFYHLHKVENFR